MPGGKRAGILQNQDVMGSDVEIRIVDPVARSSRSSNTTARPSTSNSAGVAAARFRMAPSGARLPLQGDQAADRRDRLGEGADDLAVDPGLGSSSRSRRVRPSTPGQSRCSSGRSSAAPPERRPRHGSLPCSLRRPVSDRPAPGSRPRSRSAAPSGWNAEAAGDRGQMDDGVGRATEGHQHAKARSRPTAG